MTSREGIRVVVADDHPLFRQGVVSALQSTAGIVVVGEAGDAETAVRLVRETSPDVVLLDVIMPGGGLEAARRIASDCPATRVVMLTVSESPDDLLAARLAGARAYLLKGVSARELAEVIRLVQAGQSYVAPSLELAAREPARPGTAERLARLSARERQVLDLVARGCTNQEIARELGVSTKSVKHHVMSILKKLEVRSRVEAAVLVVRAEEA